MTTELSACPFCNHATAPVLTDSREFQEEIDGWHDDSNVVTYAIACDAHQPGGPGGCGAMSGFYETVEKAVEAWNARGMPCAAVAEPVCYINRASLNWVMAMGRNQTFEPVLRKKASDDADVPMYTSAQPVTDSHQLAKAAAAVCKHWWHGDAGSNTVKLDELIGKMDTALGSLDKPVSSEQVTAQAIPASVLATAPRRIWLDLGDDLHLMEPDTTFQDLDGSVTWSEDNATGHGIEYLKAAL